MNKRLKLTKKIIYISALVFIVLFSVGYSALSQVLNIGGSTRYNKKYPVRVTGISLQGVSNSGTEQFSPNYTWNTTTTGVNLPNLNSTVTYTVTVRNYGSEDKGINLNITNNSNSNMIYETSNMPTNNVIPANSTKTFNITIKYNTSTLPETTTDTMVITYTFGKIGAMFLPGQQVNAKMKKFVNSSATLITQDTAITNIARYTGTPNSTYLTDTYKVSTDEYITPIYMWYDSTNTTIYWYTEATNIYYNPNSNDFFYNLRAINSISNMSDISSEYVTTMSSMFNYTGYNSTSFTLDLGSKFDTSNVTNMGNMFLNTGYTSTVFTLDLGDKFDTSNVTRMDSMFASTGRSSTVFTLDLGDKFDTSNVIDIQSMFSSTGRSSTVFTLDLGPKFNTSNVTNMSSMFSNTGYSNTSFTLDLGDKFDTSNVTSMSYMFYYTGYSSTVFTLDLGDKFDTSKVTYMHNMFSYTGYSSSGFTLDLGDKFDTTHITSMENMFQYAGYSSTSFTLNLGDKFDTSNVTNMNKLFSYTGYSSTVFTLDLGDKFDTSNVTDMTYMFSNTGYNSTVFTLDLGDKFDTSNVTNMQSMFSSTGRNSPVFTLDLGDLFDTSNVTSMSSMFSYTGRSSTAFALDLGDKFDTSKVTSMSYMFYQAGYSSTTFTLDLGYLFDTSSVTDMSYMFSRTGYSSPVFTLDLGDKFDTSNVTSMREMFSYVGYNSTTFTLDLGDKFDTSKVTNMYRMFSNSRYLKTIYAPTTFVATVGTNSTDMFNGCTDLVGGAGTVYNSSYINGTYAHIDVGTINPGYFTARTTATFKSGQEVNAKMKQFVNSSATYSTQDTTIKNIARYIGTPNSSYLIDANKVSTNDSQYPIYMWYDSANTTIYWYTEAGKVYYNSDSSYFYHFLGKLETISCMNYISSEYVTNMSNMFAQAGHTNLSFTLDLGDKFDTSNVTNMSNMFAGIGRDSSVFTLSLGNKFDTSKVTDMSYMFSSAGQGNPSFFLDLGPNFDTSSVTNMEYMFYNIAFYAPSFSFDLGDKFDTSNVTNMRQMFGAEMRVNTQNSNLDLGEKFDTSNVTDMSYMFNNFKGFAIYAPTSFVTTSLSETQPMFWGCSGLVGGAGSSVSTFGTDSTYAHIDGGTSNPGFFTIRGSKIAKIRYNNNTTSGSFNSKTITTSCVPASGSTSCTITVPNEVTSSVGKYNSPFKGLSTSIGNMDSSSLTISEDTTFYANYSKQVTNYYHNGNSSTNRIVYRNEFYSGSTTMKTILGTTNTSTTNYDTASGAGSSVWTGLSTGNDTTPEYTTVQDAANSNTANLYTVYTYNINYSKGSNVSSIGATTGSCKVTTATSCNVTLPSITPTSGFTSVGWSATNGDTSGQGENTSYTVSSNGSTLYANAVKYYTCPVSREPATYNFGGYQTSKYGSYQSACQSRTGANSECGTYISGYEPTSYNYNPRCDTQYCSSYTCEPGTVYAGMTCWACTCPIISNRSCTSYSCPNSVATWSYMYGEPQLQPYGDYQSQCT